VGPGVERGNEASGEFKHERLAIFRVVGATDGRRYRTCFLGERNWVET
jgi:hypothetical protein